MEEPWTVKGICGTECVHELAQRCETPNYTGGPCHCRYHDRRPSRLNTWPWGYCPSCNREILTKGGGTLILHGGNRHNHCPGSHLLPGTPPPELTAAQEKALTDVAWAEADRKKRKPWL